MKLLVDEALQDAVAHRLADADHDVTQRPAARAGRAHRRRVIALALQADRVLVTTDTDFGSILALTGAAGPNVLLLRGIGDATGERVAAILDVLP